MIQVTKKVLNLSGLKGTTTGEYIFQDVENYLGKKNLDLEILSRISTDGAPVQIGKEKAIIKLVIDKIESNNKTSNHSKYPLFDLNKTYVPEQL